MSDRATSGALSRRGFLNAAALGGVVAATARPAAASAEEDARLEMRAEDEVERLFHRYGGELGGSKPRLPAEDGG